MDLPLAYFDAVRQEEIARVLSKHGELFQGKDILEIGSGTGLQLRAIRNVANSALGLELIGGTYVRDESLNIIEYDGLHIPFPDASFDLVFSSNVMEHIAQQGQINSEIRRVLRSDGKAVHVMPTRVWRILTSVLHYPRLVKSALCRTHGSQVAEGNGSQQRTTKRLQNILIPARHGDLGGWFAEYGYFGSVSLGRSFRSIWMESGSGRTYWAHLLRELLFCREIVNEDSRQSL